MELTQKFWQHKNEKHFQFSFRISPLQAALSDITGSLVKEYWAEICQLEKIFEIQQKKPPRHQNFSMEACQIIWIQGLIKQTQVRTQMYTYTHICTLTYIYTHIYANTHTYVHINTHMYTYTYTHIHKFNMITGTNTNATIDTLEQVYNVMIWK